MESVDLMVKMVFLGHPDLQVCLTSIDWDLIEF